MKNFYDYNLENSNDHDIDILTILILNKYCAPEVKSRKKSTCIKAGIEGCSYEIRIARLM